MSQDLWVQDCVHYSSILNPFCTLSLSFHNISWPHIWICLFLLSAAWHSIWWKEHKIFIQSAIGRHELFLNFVPIAPPQWNSLYKYLVHVTSFISLEHRVLEWTLRIKGMHWIFFWMQNTVPGFPGNKGFPGSSQGRPSAWFHIIPYGQALGITTIAKVIPVASGDTWDALVTPDSGYTLCHLKVFLPTSMSAGRMIGRMIAGKRCAQDRALSLSKGGQGWVLYHRAKAARAPRLNPSYQASNHYGS